MKPPAFAALLTVALALPALAAAPKAPPLATYTSLWQSSPFTVKPQVEKTGPAVEVNPFEDWALGGVSTLNGRYRVVLFNRKEANLQKFVDQGDTSGEFQIVSVKQDPKDYKKTEVVITGSGKRGTVTYDDKVLSTRGAAAAKAAQQAQMQAKMAQARAQAQQQQPVQGQLPGVQPPQGGQPGQGHPGQGHGDGQRPPRMRVIPQPGQTPAPATPPPAPGR